MRPFVSVRLALIASNRLVWNAFKSFRKSPTLPSNRSMREMAFGSVISSAGKPAGGSDISVSPLKGSRHSRREPVYRLMVSISLILQKSRGGKLEALATPIGTKCPRSTTVSLHIDAAIRAPRVELVPEGVFGPVDHRDVLVRRHNA